VSAKHLREEEAANKALSLRERREREDAEAAEKEKQKDKGRASNKKYQVRLMPDGTTKRVEVRDLFDEDKEGEGGGGGGGGGRRRRHDLQPLQPAEALPRLRAPEEDLLEKAERLQREARVMREAASHARYQEERRAAAESEKDKAQRQVQELQRHICMYVCIFIYVHIFICMYVCVYIYI
jgi:hypothetical protein